MKAQCINGLIGWVLKATREAEDANGLGVSYYQVSVDDDLVAGLSLK